MKVDENWNKEYVDKLKKYEDAIEYMELFYGIGIDEWEKTMNPLHYLDALGYFYQWKQALVMHQLSPDLKRNDFVKYTGGSDSQYLTVGEKYRLTCSPYRNRICVINDNGKRMNTLKRYFEGA